MKRTTNWIVVGLLLGAGLAHAMRMAPAKVKPVTKDGVRYEAPHSMELPKNAPALVEAWDEKTGKKLWEQVIYRMKPDDPGLEYDGEYIATLQIDGDHLLITTERRQQYRLDLKTRKVEKLAAQAAPVKKDGPRPATPPVMAE